MSLHEQNESLVWAVIRKGLIKQIIQKDEELRKQLSENYAPGTSLTAFWGGKPIGKVMKKLPATSARIADRFQVMAWASDNAPEMLHYRVTDMDAAIKVLEEHAPDLLTLDIPDHHMANVKRRAKAGEDIPGVELVEGDSTLAVTETDTSRELAAKALMRTLHSDALKEIEQ